MWARSIVRAESRVEAVLLNGHGHKRRRRGAGARGSRTGCGVDVAGTLARQGCRRRALKPRKTSSPTCEVGKLEPRPGGRTARARYEHGRRPDGARTAPAARPGGCFALGRRRAILPTSSPVSADAEAILSPSPAAVPSEVRELHVLAFPVTATTVSLGTPWAASVSIPSLLRTLALVGRVRCSTTHSRTHSPQRVQADVAGGGVTDVEAETFAAGLFSAGSRGTRSLRDRLRDAGRPHQMLRSAVLRKRPSCTGIERRTVLPSRPRM